MLAGFLANSISSYYVSRTNVRRTITESSLPLTSDNVYSVIQRDLLQPTFISSMMANDAFLRHWVVDGEQNPKEIERYLRELRREYNTVASFFVSEATRNYYFADGILKQISEEEPRDEWYFRVREMKQPFEINVDPDLANEDAMTIFINYRVFDFEENFIGAAGVGLTVNRVNTLIEEYEERFGRHIFFCDRDGKIVLSSRDGRAREWGNLDQIPGLEPYIDRILHPGNESFSYRKEGDRYFLNSRYVPELDWVLVVEQAEDVLLASLRGTLMMNLGLAVVITAIVAFICVSAIDRHRKGLQARNEDLSRMNREINAQRLRVEESAGELETANGTLMALNREKDDFLGIVAHDLRDPLNGVLGFCEELDRDLPTERDDLRVCLEAIRSGGQQMLELTGDILNVSAIESFQGEVQLDLVNWNQLGRDVVDRFQTHAERKQIVLRAELGAETELDVLTRERWMGICLNNLVSNALKFTAAGTSVTVKTVRTAEGELELRVTDGGPGLSAEDKAQAFGKFVRLSPTPTGGETSTGLGLYIVSKMCQRLGATVEIESEVGAGASFVIRHPLVRPTVET